jgi:hypothetical protein
MRANGKYRMWYLVFSVLLLYATTADFVATTVGAVQEQNCNHPSLRIEHKCVTKSGRTRRKNDSATSSADAAHNTAVHSTAAPVTASINDPGQNSRPAIILEDPDLALSAIPQHAVPLLC